MFKLKQGKKKEESSGEKSEAQAKGNSKKAGSKKSKFGKVRSHFNAAGQQHDSHPQSMKRQKTALPNQHLGP